MKKRIDVLLTEKGFFSSRSKAVMAIKDSCIMAGEKIVQKPNETYEDDVEIKIVSAPLRYVSRGGLKLEKAINVFNIDFTDKVVLDLGASTGGFTDCALQHGAKKVFAVDIGSGQLVESLRKDTRVVNLENTDAKNLDKKIFDECDYIVADISFVSIAKIIASIADKVTKQKLMLLVKPQFECGISLAKKHKGIIRDKSLSKEIADKTIKGIEGLGFTLLGLDESPIKGGDGNTEFITLWGR